MAARRAAVAAEPAASAPVSDPAGNKAAARVLRLLSRFADEIDSYGVSELSRETGMTKNMVHRALTTLARHGYVVRDETGTRYQLGPGVLRLATAGLPELDLARLCDPYMRRLRDLSGESVTLTVPSGRSAVTIGGVRGRGLIAHRVTVGRITPLHISAASRAILAAFPDDAIARYLEQPLQRLTRRTLVTPGAIWAEVHAVRARGYATVMGDQWQGTSGIAFAVSAQGEYPHGSIGVCGPAERLNADRLNGVLPNIFEIAGEINHRTNLYPSEYFTSAK